MAALARSLDAYIMDGGQAMATRVNHAKFWGWWQRHCKRVAERREVTIDPLAAPFFVFEELFTEFTEDGRRYAVGTIDNVVGAVRARYEAAGLVPPHKSA